MPGQHALHALDRPEEIRYLMLGQICQAEAPLQGADEHMARKERLQIHHCETVGGLEEDLVRFVFCLGSLC